MHSRDGATVDILLSNCFNRQDEHTIFTGGGETEIQLSEISKPWGQQLLLFKTNTMLCVLTSGKVSTKGAMVSSRGVEVPLVHLVS